MSLRHQPIFQAEAFEFIRLHHRHHAPPVGWLFGVAVNDSEHVVGVVIVGRPVARMSDDGYTAEVTRLCTLDSEGSRNAASILYSAAWRAARAMGYRRLVTYILKSETGTSLKAAGWRCIGQTSGGSWDRKSRPRVDKHPTGQKQLWEPNYV